MNRRRLALLLLAACVVFGAVGAFAVTVEGRPAQTETPGARATKTAVALHLVDPLRPLCTAGAAGVAGTAAYAPGPGPHPAVALMTLNGTKYFQDQTTLPESWEARALGEVQLVVCEEDSGILIERCTFAGEHAEGAGTLDRMQNQMHVRLIAAATGEVVATETFLGGMPRECGETPPSGSGVEVFGSQVAASDVQAWLRGYVAP